MATQSPFPFLDDLFSKLASGVQPPAWMLDEIQRRQLLVANHVLMQEPQAQARLARQAGRLVEARWRRFGMRLRITPAGLLELAGPGGEPDLTAELAEESPWQLAQAAFRGDKPSVRIAGDVQLAADINWLVEHVRWDFEEDLSHVIGDVPAHAIAEALRRMLGGVRAFAGRSPDRPGQAGA